MDNCIITKIKYNFNNIFIFKIINNNDIIYL